MPRPINTISESALHRLCGLEDDERVPDKIDTHDGFWSREHGRRFRFYPVDADLWPYLPDLDAVKSQSPAQDDAAGSRQGGEDQNGRS